MNDTIEREYRYSYGKEFVSCFGVAAAILVVVAAFMFYSALTNSVPVELKKGVEHIELQGIWANLALAAVGLVNPARGGKGCYRRTSHGSQNSALFMV